MIIKFDHISYIQSRVARQETPERHGEPSFKEEGLENPAIKKALMESWQKDHDLYYYVGSLPVEHIFYDKVHAGESLVRDGDAFHGKYSSKSKAAAFLQSLFPNGVSCQGDDILCNMKGVLDKRDFYLILHQQKGHIGRPSLDTRGYGVPAVVAKGWAGCPVEGAVVTSYEAVRVNGVDMEICFAASDAVNVIFEVIKIGGGQG